VVARPQRLDDLAGGLGFDLFLVVEIGDIGERKDE